MSNFRVHRAWPAAADADATPAALRRVVFDVLLRGGGGVPSPLADSAGLQAQRIDDDNSALDSNARYDDYEAMQTAYRVTNSATEDGDPGPEGVHQDAAHLTAVVLVGRDNVRGGLNRVWSLDQPCGKPSVADLTSNRLLAEVTLEMPFDTLLVRDREVKHEATAIAPADVRRPAVRDVLTFEVRPPMLAEAIADGAT